MGSVIGGNFGGGIAPHEGEPGSSVLPPQGDFANEHDIVEPAQHWGSVYDLPFPERLDLVHGLLGSTATEKAAGMRRHPSAHQLTRPQQ